MSRSPSRASVCVLIDTPAGPPASALLLGSIAVFEDIFLLLKLEIGSRGRALEMRL